MVICEACDIQLEEEKAWGPDEYGVYLCVPCVNSHIEESAEVEYQISHYGPELL